MSAGILLWRMREGRLQVLLAHPGGPFWVNKDHGHWTIPKGETDPGEELVDVARREFAEETGHAVPDGELIVLGQIRQKSGKRVWAWAVMGDLDPAAAVSNSYEMEWPPRSGRIQSFPEIDRVEWFDLDEAQRRLKAAQTPFLDRLVAALPADSPAEPLTSIGVKRLAWLGTQTTRYVETKEFYERVLGLTLVVEDPGVAVYQLPGGEYDFVEVIDAHGPEAEEVFTGPVPGLLVADVVRARRQLEAAGLEMLGPIRWWDFPGSDLPLIPGYGWFRFRGPDGSVYCCMQGSRALPD